MIDFDSATRLVPAGDGTLRGTVTPDWAQGRASFGGLVTGLAARALDGLVPGDRPLRSITTDFAAAIGPGQLLVKPTIVRTGKSLTHAHVELSQDGNVCALVQAVFGAARASPLQVPAAPRPVRTHPAEIEPFPYLEGLTPVFTQHFEYRWTSPLPFAGATEPVLGGWIRHATPTRLDAAALLALIDAWPAPVLPMFERPAPASTVTWLVNLAPLDPTTPADGWWLFDADTNQSAGGYADVNGRLWDPAGRLVATSRQLVAEFS